MCCTNHLSIVVLELSGRVAGVPAESVAIRIPSKRRPAASMSPTSVGVCTTLCLFLAFRPPVWDTSLWCGPCMPPPSTPCVCLLCHQYLRFSWCGTRTTVVRRTRTHRTSPPQVGRNWLATQLQPTAAVCACCLHPWYQVIQLEGARAGVPVRRQQTQQLHRVPQSQARTQTHTRIRSHACIQTNTVFITLMCQLSSLRSSDLFVSRGQFWRACSSRA